MDFSLCYKWFTVLRLERHLNGLQIRNMDMIPPTDHVLENCLQTNLSAFFFFCLLGRFWYGISGRSRAHCKAQLHKPPSTGVRACCSVSVASNKPLTRLTFSGAVLVTCTVWMLCLKKCTIRRMNSKCKRTPQKNGPCEWYTVWLYITSLD